MKSDDTTRGAGGQGGTAGSDPKCPDSLEQLRQIINHAENIVFFGGAGVSTESGIPDFRSKDGLYNLKYQYPPEEILSRSFFDAQPGEFYRFYFDKVLHPAAQANAAHLALARLEQAGKLKAVVTQNIDGLHQAAGSQEVVELHGSILRNYCVKCGAEYDLGYVLGAQVAGVEQDRAGLAPTAGPAIVAGAETVVVNTIIPRCSRAGCDGIVRPDVVMYEEALDGNTIDRALHFISRAEVLIVGGTSLVVYPAASFIQYFRGSKLVILNKAETQGDSSADLVIREPIGQVLGSVVD